MSDTDEKKGASTFAKGLRVLECFEGGARGLTMAGISKTTGMDRATVRRLCLTLVESGYLAQSGHELHLTPRILAPAGGYLMANDFGRAIQPVLTAFAQELGGEISMAVRDRDRALYVAQSVTPGARLSIGFVVGSSIPLLPTAIGRMLLASSPHADRERALRRLPHIRYTDATDTDPASLDAKISAAADQGYAVVRGEFEAGVTALAVAVGNHAHTTAVIGTSVAGATLEDDAERARMLDILRRAARSLRGPDRSAPR
ncbi:IclR family transcriptional regulator [Pararhodobacter zhoushanensis]|uniref:IclR family transcriptional regulator n=1 Tax=Pararhodobacter zhoushanensis TaxID=2479545 RepID=UPI000F8DA6FB|nr:IclR family transcriptional regulator C-terminal domain-containing protein [Pararhodobacter zhoushanensis]